MSASATGDERSSSLRSEMDGVALEQALGDIELGLIRDDPRLVRRLRRRARAERANTIVVVLLVATALLLAVGLASSSWIAWVAGGSAFVGAFAVDNRYRHRTPRSRDLMNRSTLGTGFEPR